MPRSSDVTDVTTPSQSSPQRAFQGRLSHCQRRFHHKLQMRGRWVGWLPGLSSQFGDDVHACGVWDKRCGSERLAFNTPFDT